MRQRLNDSPLFALGLIGVLAIAVALLFLSGKGNSGATTATPAGATAVTPSPPTATPSTAIPLPTIAAPAVSPAGPVGAPTTFRAGPGLPKPVVAAHAHNEVVVLLVFKRNGIDDTGVRQLLGSLPKRADFAFFQTAAKNIAKYSRIAVGVDVNRVPAIVVIRPSKSKRATPVATVTYGYHGAGSIRQAIRDARYKGPNDLPAYPR